MVAMALIYADREANSHRRFRSHDSPIQSLHGIWMQLVCLRRFYDATAKLMQRYRIDNSRVEQAAEGRTKVQCANAKDCLGYFQEHQQRRSRNQKEDGAALVRVGSCKIPQCH
jgi:hypothetical protein